MKKSFIKIKPRKNTSKAEFKTDITLIDFDENESDDELTIPTVNKINGRTNISDIMKLEGNDFISFYNRVKNPKKWVITMYDLVSMKQIPEKTNIHCFWCRHPHKFTPIGCPIKMVNSEFIEKWIFKNNEYVAEKTNSITEYQIEEYKKLFSGFYSSLTESKGNIEHSMKIKKSGKFITTGLFCSFNCTQAFINDEVKKNNFMYKSSTYLLANMYKYYTGKYHHEQIPSAPSYELLVNYGGKLTIEKFRDSFLTTTFTNVKNIYIPTGSIYSEEIIF